MSYAAEHAAALADVRVAGAAVTFTRDTSTVDEDTDTVTTPTQTTIAGYAIEKRGDPDEYRTAGVVELDPATLFFVPTTFGDLPKAGDLFTWGGVVRAVKRVTPLAPDGTAIATTIIGATG